MAKKKKIIVTHLDTLELIEELQDELNVMYQDRRDKGYNSAYLIAEIQAREVEINKLNDIILSEEYDKDGLTDLHQKLVMQQKSNAEDEKDLLKKMEAVKLTKRLLGLRANSLSSLLISKEGPRYLENIALDVKLNDFDYSSLDVVKMCDELNLKLRGLHPDRDTFVLKMLSFFTTNEAFKGYKEEDIRLLFIRNFVVNNERLQFADIKEIYYPDGKSQSSYVKLYKALKDKFKKVLLFHPELKQM